MKSQNFEFLRSRLAVVADLGGFAERYAHSDPNGSLTKQRSVIEELVQAIYQGYRLHPPYSDNLNDLLIAEEFRQAVPDVVQDKLHAVRIAGNKAVHQRRQSTSQLALERLQQTFEIAQWVYLQVAGGSRSECPTYQAPAPEPATNGKAREALEKLRLAEARYEAVLASLAEERRLRDEDRKRLDAAEEAAAQTTAEQEQIKAARNPPTAELEQLKSTGQQIASSLHFDELTTRRRLIDQMLLDAGWNVGAHGANTEDVRQEVALGGLRTASGDGRADYVLYGANGKPLAVVEAKRTMKDAREGAEQARDYADSLEQSSGQRPVIFCSNGFDLYIEDDAQHYPRRRVYGFYSPDSIAYLIHQRAAKQNLATFAPNLAITDRIYQLEAIKRIGDRFAGNFRKALIVQATGTGKTRVAVSLCELLMRAGWAKRILFLCDRRELRRQADRVFKQYLPGEPRVVIDSTTAGDRDQRIYLATYPAMMKCYEDYDVGFFDLIVADESHRSIYKKFGTLFKYFDALQVGLTATPRASIDHHTYKMFECEDRDPTAHFSFEEAVGSSPAYLVPFRVRSFTSQFRQKGLKYSMMSEAQRAQLEDQEEVPESVEYDAHELDKHVFNKDTTRHIWRSLMAEGIRDATGSRVGKTIVFARNHDHAVHLAEQFSELYPQYGSTFCRVIDNQEPRREQLIDDFKNPDHELTIAVSVDMLDTGIDVPEVVNLVFAKPVRSYVKFWQMIGRGTRLCRDLFGPGRHKTEFLIFDHWSNFWFFDEHYQEKQPAAAKSLLQHLFEARVALLEAGIDKLDEPAIGAASALVLRDLRATRNIESLEVRDRWAALELLADTDRIIHMAPATKVDLLSIAAPLQQWHNIRGEEDGYRFDLLMTRLQVELVKEGPQGARVQDLKARVQAAVELLAKNQNPVKAHADSIQRIRDKAFWTTVTVQELEGLRIDLRGIMRYQQTAPTGRVATPIFDITDTDLQGETYVPRLEGLDLIEYRRRVGQVIDDYFANDPTLEKIRTRQPVAEQDLEELARLVLQVDDKANVRHLAGYRPETRRSLTDVFRSLVGLDAAAVERAFAGFVHKHPAMTSQQLHFMQLLQNHISRHGGIDIDRLYEPPFTTLHAESVDGIFPDPAQVSEVLGILGEFPSPVESAV